MQINKDKALAITMPLRFATGFALTSLIFFFVPMYIPMPEGAIKTPFEATRCNACHADVWEEFSKTEVHKTLECNSCHSISEFGADLYSHNATTLGCVDCHTDQEKQFGRDAHTNEKNMCIGCHTRAKVIIEKRVYEGMNYVVAPNNGSWSIGITLSGEKRYLEVIPIWR